MSETIHAFDSASDLANTLAADVAQRLDAATKERGTASIAVSGGSTPKLFFQALSQHDLDWPNISVTLVDERFAVSYTHLTLPTTPYV